MTHWYHWYHEWNPRNFITHHTDNLHTCIYKLNYPDYHSLPNIPPYQFLPNLYNFEQLQHNTVISLNIVHCWK